MPAVRSCALVCREWNDTFTPLLYSLFDSRSSRSIAIKLLCVHARIVHLSMGDPAVKILQEGSATNVHELELSGDGNVYESVPAIWILLSQQNPHLVSLTCPGMPYSTLEDMVCLTPNLQKLAVYRHQFRQEAPDLETSNNWLSFWRIAKD